VTGHDGQRKAIVVRDENLPVTVRRPGQEGWVVWTNDGIPADNLDATQDSREAATHSGKVVFRVLRYEAGASGRMHRTQSLDYAVIVNGSIVLELDDGAEVILNAGDTLVQRGTVHRWINRSTEACTIAFVLIDAVPIATGENSTLQR
jgi:quercetin dioxygenase-like cupin family protein